MSLTLLVEKESPPGYRAFSLFCALSLAAIWMVRYNVQAKAQAKRVIQDCAINQRELSKF